MKEWFPAIAFHFIFSAVWRPVCKGLRDGCRLLADARTFIIMQIIVYINGRKKELFKTGIHALQCRLEKFSSITYSFLFRSCLNWSLIKSKIVEITFKFFSPSVTVVYTDIRDKIYAKSSFSLFSFFTQNTYYVEKELRVPRSLYFFIYFSFKKIYV